MQIYAAKINRMSYSEHDERRLYRAEDKISRQIGVSDREKREKFLSQVTWREVEKCHLNEKSFWNVFLLWKKFLESILDNWDLRSLYIGLFPGGDALGFKF